MEDPDLRQQKLDNQVRVPIHFLYWVIFFKFSVKMALFYDKADETYLNVIWQVVNMGVTNECNAHLEVQEVSHLLGSSGIGYTHVNYVSKQWVTWPARIYV